MRLLPRSHFQWDPPEKIRIIFQKTEVLDKAGEYAHHSGPESVFRYLVIKNIIDNVGLLPLPPPASILTSQSNKSPKTLC